MKRPGRFQRWLETQELFWGPKLQSRGRRGIIRGVVHTPKTTRTSSTPLIYCLLHAYVQAVLHTIAHQCRLHYTTHKG